MKYRRNSLCPHELAISTELFIKYVFPKKILISDFRILILIAQTSLEWNPISNKKLAEALEIKNPEYVSKRIAYMRKLGVLETKTTKQKRDPERSDSPSTRRAIRVNPNLIRTIN